MTSQARIAQKLDIEPDHKFVKPEVHSLLPHYKCAYCINIWEKLHTRMSDIDLYMKYNMKYRKLHFKL